MKLSLPILVSLLVIALALIAGFWWKTDREASPETPPESSASTSSSTEPANLEAVIVDYTDVGYEPDRVRVPLGTTVTWRNDSSKPMWTASDPHPMHTIYPEFDAKVGVEPGASYSFTFTKRGTWSYHNHAHEHGVDDDHGSDDREELDEGIVTVE